MVYVLSDSTGNLARHMMVAFQTQFAPEALVIQMEPFLRTMGRLTEVLQRANENNAAVCHAMVSGKFKKIIAEFCRKNSLPCCDLTGGIVDFLSRVTGATPRENVGSLHKIDAAYKRRIGALEYTISHDDGLGLATLHEADIVLVGVSRTSKTPTSIYLAQQGYRVANVALAYGIAPPEELLSLEPERVIGLVVDPQQLSLVRNRRQSSFGIHDAKYSDPDYVAREIAWTRRLFAQRGWRILDVTDQAIEETAARAIDAIAYAPLRDSENGDGSAELS